MKSILRISGFFIICFLVASSDAFAQEKAVKSVTEAEIASRICDRLGPGYQANCLVNLEKIGITPLGKWTPDKFMTKDDFDAILIRMARRNPILENAEPAKILDSMGFPPRDVSSEGVEKVLNSEAFKRIIINSSLIMCQPIMPLPPKYQALGMAVATQGRIEMSTLPSIAIAIAAEPGGDTEPSDDGDDDDGDDDDIDDPHKP